MKRMTTCLVIILFLMGAYLAVNTAQGDEISKGKGLYQGKCMICHGAEGKGDGPAASAFSKRPADFNNPEFWKGDVEKKIGDTIRNGRQPMPAFRLSSDEIHAIIDYMKQSFRK